MEAVRYDDDTMYYYSAKEKKKIFARAETKSRKKMPRSSSIDDGILIEWLKMCFTVHCTIFMVYFKPKSRTRKSDPYKSAKSRIESYAKVGIGG